MKTHKNLRLKKELLIIELPEDNWITVFPKLIWINDRETGKFHHIKGSYTLLGSPDEIKEDDAKELVESWESVAKDGTMVYENYKDDIPKKRTATESLLSAIERYLHWKNPYGKPKGNSNGSSEYYYAEQQYYEAEKNTYDRNRTLIFVKN